MSETLVEVEAALQTVKRTLDALTSRGDDQAAFDLARAHFATSIRASWPSSLSGLITPLARVAGDESLKLTQDERADLGAAIEGLRRATGQ